MRLFAYKKEVLILTPNSKPVFVNCNPIAVYNYGIDIYNVDCNQINGIQLMKICCPCLISWIYDLIIYFYTLFFSILSCAYCEKWGFVYTLFMLFIYVALLIVPGLSVFTFTVSALFFLYYIAGVIVSIKNKHALGGHNYQERMVPASKAPAFDGNLEFYDIKSSTTSMFYFQSSMMEYFSHIK